MQLDGALPPLALELRLVESVAVDAQNLVEVRRHDVIRVQSGGNNVKSACETGGYEN
jgi:hypothetical protein